MHTLALFDIDGTLLKGSDLHRRSFHAALKEVFGIEAHVHEIDHNGMVDKGIMLALLARRGIPWDDARIDSAIRSMCRHYLERAGEGDVWALAGASELLSDLERHGVPMGLLTGNAKDIAFKKMRLSGLARFFRTGGFGDDAYERKALVPIAVERAGRGFDRVVIIGDTPRDIEAARLGGADSVAVATGKYSLEELRAHAPTHLAPDLTDKESIVRWIAHKA